MKLNRNQSIALIIISAALLAYVGYNEFQKYDNASKAKALSQNL